MSEKEKKGEEKPMDDIPKEKDNKDEKKVEKPKLTIYQGSLCVLVN